MLLAMSADAAAADGENFDEEADEEELLEADDILRPLASKGARSPPSSLLSPLMALSWGFGELNLGTKATPEMPASSSTKPSMDKGRFSSVQPSSDHSFVPKTPHTKLTTMMQADQQAWPTLMPTARTHTVARMLPVEKNW